MNCAVAALLLVMTSIASAAPYPSSLDRHDRMDEQHPFPRLSIAAKVERDKARGDLPLSISGTVTYFVPQEASSGGSPESICFFLPYNDASTNQPVRSSRRFEYLTEKSGKKRLLGGSTTVDLSNAATDKGAADFSPRIEKGGSKGPYIETIAAHVIKVLNPGPEIKLDFKSLVPRPASFSSEDFLIDRFYPTPLIRCPATSLDSGYFTLTTSEISGSIYYPSGWQYIGPGSSSNSLAQVRIRARAFGFFLGRGFKMSVVREDEPRLRIWYRDDEVADLNETLSHAVETQERIFGKFPFPSLDLVESSEAENPTLPGLISINRPRQEILRSVQSEWLNWRQWLITAFTANQWYGQSIATDSPDDGWLLDGIADFATLEALSASKLRYNLFKPFRKGFHIFTFNYLQIQELVASSLRRNAPTTRLTDAEYVTLAPLSQSHPLSFIRHVMAMRQIKSETGDHAIASWLRQITKRNEHNFISPRGFMQALSGVPSPFSPAQRQELTGYLNQWWTSDGWPDFSLGEVSYTQLRDGKWATSVKIKQSGKIKVPAKVGFIETSGNLLIVNSEQSGNNELLALGITGAKPSEIVIDPNHEIYDANRYDNKSSFTAIKFFPGNARTLADDEYTLIWAPYAFRHPGEPLSVGLQGVIFKYLQGSTRIRAENHPSDGRNSGFLHHISDFPEIKTNIQLLIKQYYSQDRVGELSFMRSPFLFSAPLLNVGGKFRYRENIDEPDSSHTTIAINSNLKQIGTNGRLANAKVSVESEHAPKTNRAKFAYVRNTATAGAGFTISRRGGIEYSLRTFYGNLSQVGNSPSGTSFRLNNLDEARVRIDSSLLPMVTAVRSINNELSFPLFIPMPWNSLVLSRNIRWRSFYDYGYSPDLKESFRAGGLGIDVPFGGDIVGAGSLTFSKISVLAVLYSSSAGKVSQRPTFLFDITGEL